MQTLKLIDNQLTFSDCLFIYLGWYITMDTFNALNNHALSCNPFPEESTKQNWGRQKIPDPHCGQMDWSDTDSL